MDENSLKSLGLEGMWVLAISFPSINICLKTKLTKSPAESAAATNKMMVQEWNAAP
jgi:hypothetical protein